VDAVCSLKPARSVDIAAAQLLVRERGLSIELPDGALPFGEAALDLEGRSRVVAAGNSELCRQLAAALSA
jgi:fructose-1,6-bisphosphatase/inositol monophosphatase family enzyme